MLRPRAALSCSNHESLHASPSGLLASTFCRKLQWTTKPVGYRGPATSKGRLRVCCALEAAETRPIYADADKEKSRRYRRTVFTHEDWINHRSTSRYGRHLLGLIQSRIVRGLAVPLGAVVIIAAFATAYESSREAGLLPAWCIRLTVDSSEPFNLTSFALSLLLVFRTNESFARWLDARKIWGGIVNRSRDLVRQGLTWMSPEREVLRRMLERWVVAFPKALMCHLCYEEDLERELKDVLEPQELEALLRASHRPNYVGMVLAEIVRAAELNDSEVFLMEANLSFFMDAVGGCERIFKTPIPLSYSRHTSRFLVIWVAFLPFTLYNTCRWATVPISAIVAFLLLGIEEIGVNIEEPFSILPLGSLCEVIQVSIREMYDRHEEVQELVQSQLPPLPDSASPNGLQQRSGPQKLAAYRDGA